MSLKYINYNTEGKIFLICLDPYHLAIPTKLPTSKQSKKNRTRESNQEIEYFKHSVKKCIVNHLKIISMICLMKMDI